MATWHVLAAAMGIATAAALANTRGSRTPDDAALRSDLAALARRAVFFGHQSVGANLLDGIAVLAAREGVPLRVIEVAAPFGAAPGTISHALVGANGDPAGKLESFARGLAAGPADAAQIALVKLCYADFGPDTDAAALFARYQAVFAELRARHPRTTFLHVTTPLTTVQAGVKGLAKRLLGRQPYGLAENARREAYNDLLRAAYGGGPLFDLARVESTRPDGSRETVEQDGRAVPALVPAYTDDGGHLNDLGRLRAARALVAVLAAAPLGGPAVARDAIP